MNLKHYNAQFMTSGNGLRLGTGTEVHIRDLGSKIASLANGEHEIVVTAVVELVARGTLMARGRYHQCHACGIHAPVPDADGLWYILENHDGNRLLFAHAEQDAYDAPERDSYPATGWALVDGELTCGECAMAFKVEMEKARDARRKR